MNVRLLEIETPVPTPGDYEIRICLDLDGQARRFTIVARPRRLAGEETILLSGSRELEDCFRQEQVVLHRLYRLVGEELRGREVIMPQQVAA